MALPLVVVDLRKKLVPVSKLRFVATLQVNQDMNSCPVESRQKAFDKMMMLKMKSKKLWVSSCDTHAH